MRGGMRFRSGDGKRGGENRRKADGAIRRGMRKEEKIMRGITIIDDLKPVYAVVLYIKNNKKVRLATGEEILIFKREKVYYKTFKLAEQARECAKNILRKNKKCIRTFVYEVDLKDCEMYGYEE